MLNAHYVLPPHRGHGSRDIEVGGFLTIQSHWSSPGRCIYLLPQSILCSLPRAVPLLQFRSCLIKGLIAPLHSYLQSLHLRAWGWDTLGGLEKGGWLAESSPQGVLATDPQRQRPVEQPTRALFWVHLSSE